VGKLTIFLDKRCNDTIGKIEQRMDDKVLDEVRDRITMRGLDPNDAILVDSHPSDPSQGFFAVPCRNIMFLKAVYDNLPAPTEEPA